MDFDPAFDIFRFVRTMEEQILILSQTFPWIRDEYMKLLTLDSTAELLSKAPAIFDGNTIFKKLISFWKNSVNEKAVSILPS